jgi:hypothetical protein
MDKMTRPKSVVLPESAQPPDRNLLRPPPNQFSHLIEAEQPYYFNGVTETAPPAGCFSAGTRVLLLRQDNRECWVADGRGLYVAIACNGIRPAVQELSRNAGKQTPIE